MWRDSRRHCVQAGLLAVVAALAPAQAQQQDPPPPPVPAVPAGQEAPAPNSLETLGKARMAAATKTFDLAWVYFSENRIDAGDVYLYSRLKLTADQDVATDKASRVEAARGHRERMAKLWQKVSRVRKLGFGSSLDLNEAEYYIREADFWVAREQAWEDR